MKNKNNFINLLLCIEEIFNQKFKTDLRIKRITLFVFVYAFDWFESLRERWGRERERDEGRVGRERSWKFLETLNLWNQEPITKKKVSRIFFYAWTDNNILLSDFYVFYLLPFFLYTYDDVYSPRPKCLIKVHGL